MSIVAKTIIDQVDEEPVKHQKAEKKSGNRIGYNYIILKSLKESKKNDVVKCLYIKSLTRFGFCVIKEGTSGDSKDKHGRDIRDRLMWQEQLHAMLQDKIRMPRLLGSFEENGNYYLVIERIRGKSLHTVFKEAGSAVQEGLLSGNKTGMKFLDYLVRIVEILEVMHQHQVVHRDVTLNNFMIMPGGKVAIIDMELSYSLAAGYPNPPFQLGTIGYMSPEQELIAVPTVKEDIFSIGAIMLQLWTGISPYKLTTVSREELQRKVGFLVPDKLLADLVARCMDPEPERRPLAGEIKKVLVQFTRDLMENSVRVSSKKVPFSMDELLETVQNGITALGSPLMADPEKGWFSENMKIPSEDKNKINKTWYASFNRGASGIIYFLAKAKSVGFDVSATTEMVTSGLELIREKYIDNPGRSNPGLHFGSDGIAVALATAITHGLIEESPEYVSWINRLLQDDTTAEDVIKGIAGQGLANLLCERFVPEDLFMDRMESYAQRLIERQSKEGYWLRDTEISRKRTVPGFGNGVAGITSFLLEFGRKINHEASLDSAYKALNWLMKIAEKKDGELSWRSFSGKTLPFSFFEGAPGIVLPFLRAYGHVKREDYRDLCVAALFRNGDLRVQSSLSQSYGLSGAGETYLEAAMILEDPAWTVYASSIIQSLGHLKRSKGDCSIYWLVENERQPLANFMIGNAGVLHLLLRFCYPEKVNFPLLP